MPGELGCLHCEISELMMRRQAAGEKLSVQVLGAVCEVIADMGLSVDPGERTAFFEAACAFLDKFEGEISAGTFKVGVERVDPARFRQ